MLKLCLKLGLQYAIRGDIFFNVFVRITEDDHFRITEDGLFRITEDAP